MASSINSIDLGDVYSFLYKEYMMNICFHNEKLRKHEYMLCGLCTSMYLM